MSDFDLSAFGQGFVAIISGIILVAIVAVIVAPKAQTAGLINDGGAALAKILKAAVSPAGSASTNGNLAANVFTAPVLTQV